MNKKTIGKIVDNKNEDCYLVLDEIPRARHCRINLVKDGAETSTMTLKINKLPDRYVIITFPMVGGYRGTCESLEGKIKLKRNSLKSN